jgi:hypothetical protein
MQLNPSKPIAGLFAFLFFVYLGYTILASDPLERMNRTCTPVTLWPGKLVVSAVRIFSPDRAPSMQESFNHGFGTCRRWVWGVLYRDDYLKAKAAEEQREAATADQALVQKARAAQ